MHEVVADEVVDGAQHAEQREGAKADTVEGAIQVVIFEVQLHHTAARVRDGLRWRAVPRVLLPPSAPPTPLGGGEMSSVKERIAAFQPKGSW